MRLLSRLLIAGAMAFGAARAAEAAVVFDYDGTCTSFCGVIGLNVGDPVSGSISFDDAAIVPDGAVSPADVLSFTFDFGTVDITSATAAAFFIAGVLDGTGSAFAIFLIDVSEALSPATGDAIHASDIAFFAGPAGNCNNVSCTSLSVGPTAGQGFPGGTLVLRQVPEPGTLALFGGALVGLTLVRRRRLA